MIRQGPDASTVAREANAVLQLGCDDPLVFYLAGRARFEGDRQDAYVDALLSRALAGFEGTQYPRGVARFAAAALVDDFRRRRFTPPLREKAETLTGKWIQESLSDGSYAAGDEAAFMSHFAKPGNGRTYVDAHPAQFAAMVAGTGAFPDWVKRYFSGRQFHGEAWKVRGSGYANTVSAESWKLFAELMAKARRDLEASWRGEPRRPEAAALMISVANSDGRRDGESERVWFDRSVAAEFDYLPAYTGFAWALRPRWGGSLAAMRAFGTACANTKRYDTAVPAFVLRVAEDIDSEFKFMLNSNVRALDDPTTAAVVEATFEGYEKSNLPAAQLARYRTRYARVLLPRREFAKAARLMERNGWQAAPPAVLTEADDWSFDEDDHLEGNEMVGRTVILAGPAGASFEAAESSAARGKVDAAALQYREARKALANSADAGATRAQELLDARLQAVEDEARLRKGEWVRYLPPPSLLGWRTHLGNWVVEPDGALRATAGSCGTLIVRALPIGPNFEIRGTIEFLGRPTQGEDVIQAGVVAGAPDFGQTDWSSARIWRDMKNPAQSKLRVARGFQGQADYNVDPPAASPFLARCVNGTWSFVLNGKLVCENVVITGKETVSPLARVGLGGYAAGHPAEIRYRNVELRRLNPAPGGLALK